MKYWNSNLKKMTEYIPGEQPQDIKDYIKLNTNENPFPPSKFILDEMKKACNEKIRLYPDPMCKSLRDTFAIENEIMTESIFVGNGSDEIFTLLFRGFIEPTGLAGFPYPSYSLYYTMAEANGINYEKINVDISLQVNLKDFLKKKYDLVIIGNPNNPTGRGVDIDHIRAFLDKFKGLLVVDEAYVDFYNETALPLIKEYNNIIVTRSFSKSYSLAGLRVGLALANEDIVKGFFKLKDSYNIDRVAEAGARAALLDKTGFKYNRDMIINNKEYLEEILREYDFTIVPSKANFLFVKHPRTSSEEIYLKLKEKKILVRYFKGDLQSEYVRISIGTMEQIKILLSELAAIVKVS